MPVLLAVLLLIAQTGPITWPPGKIVLMEDTNLAAMYQATVYPIYVVIDRDGNIAGTQRGAGGEEALRRLLARGGIASKDDSDSD